jgi:hypothetical protein
MYGLTPFAPLISMLGLRIEELAGARGLEPAASCVTGQTFWLLLFKPNPVRAYGFTRRESRDFAAKVQELTSRSWNSAATTSWNSQ